MAERDAEKRDPKLDVRQSTSVNTTILREELAPSELTGRAAQTAEDLTALFENSAAEHITDGFNGGSDDDTGVAPQTDGSVDAIVPAPARPKDGQ